MLGQRIIQNRMWFITGCLSLCFILLAFRPFPPPYHFPWLKPRSDEIQIALEAKELTRSDATFIVPWDFSAFRYYAERSLYVDYKSVAHHGSYYQTWWPRIQTLYGLNPIQPGDLEKHRQMGSRYYHSLGKNEIKKLPVDYMVTDTSQMLTLPRIASAGRYVIYQIR